MMRMTWRQVLLKQQAHYDNPGQMAIRTKTHKLIYFYGRYYESKSQPPHGRELHDLTKY